MKKTTFLYTFAFALLVGLATALPVAAQHHGRMGDFFVEELDLTEAQQEQLKAVREEHRAEMQAWREANSEASREDKRAFFEQQREEMQDTLDDILTPEQQQRLEELKAQRGERRGQRGHRRAHRAHAWMHLGEKLDLTEAQKEQLKALREEHRSEMQAWRDANPEASREEQRAFFKAQRAAMQDALADVFTPEQQEQLKALKERRGERGRRGRRGHRRAHGWQHLSDQLDLTEVQKEDILALRQAHRETLEAWRAAHPNATREELRAYRKEQAEALREAINAVLTPEQRERLDELKAERRERKGDRRDRGGDRGDATPETPRTSAFALSNYPNPFNPSTEIQFTLEQESPVSLVVYDVQGRAVRELLDGSMSSGPHTVRFDATGLPTGTYLYRLTVGEVTETGRMTLVK